jgi:hypothetical protein
LALFWHNINYIAVMQQAKLWVSFFSYRGKRPAQEKSLLASFFVCMTAFFVFMGLRLSRYAPSAALRSAAH